MNLFIINKNRVYQKWIISTKYCNNCYNHVTDQATICQVCNNDKFITDYYNENLDVFSKRHKQYIKLQKLERILK